MDKSNKKSTYLICFRIILTLLRKIYCQKMKLMKKMCIIIEEHLCKPKEKFSKYFHPTKDIRKNYNWLIYSFV
jgi:hypothetical protein